MPPQDRPPVVSVFFAFRIMLAIGFFMIAAALFGAWLLWRGIYLGKLPGLERKIRVLSDWVIELFFPRDIVQTIELK